MTGRLWRLDGSAVDVEGGTRGSSEVERGTESESAGESESEQETESGTEDARRGVRPC